MDFMTLQVIWWFLVGVVLVIYSATAGFDFGSTMMLPFMKNEDERRVVLNTVAPTWDGNQTWIVLGGGAIFVVWPVVYSTMFSGLYAAMLCILWAFFLRPPGFDYRGKIQSHKWRRMWDYALFISAFLPTLIFGVAFGNLFLGLPFHFDPMDMRDFYTGNFFGLLSPFAILSGVIAILMYLMHGAAYQARRTEGVLRAKMVKLQRVSQVLFFVCFTVAGYLIATKITGYTLVASPVDPTANPLANEVTTSVGAWISSYSDYSWKMSGPILAYAALIISFLTSGRGHGHMSFWASVLTTAGTIFTAGFALFPFIVPSSTNPSQSLTVWNASSAQYSLLAMFYTAVVCLVIILGYKIFAYRAIWSKKSTLTAEDIKKDDHSFY